MKLRRPSPLALRIYLLGLAQFLIVAIAMEVNRQASHRADPWERDTKFVAEGFGPKMDDPKAVEAEALRVTKSFRWKIDVVDPDGRVMTHAENTTAHFESGGPHGSQPIKLPDGRVGRLDYVIALPLHLTRWHVPHLPLWFGSPLVIVLLVVGVTSFLMTRSLTSSLARLTEATRAFGAGKLDARANMRRRDEIGEVARAFDDMADRIARLLLAERELLANVSHELRTPLARIRVALDLANEAEPRTAMESLGEIATDLAELERIVDDVLASARLALHGEAPASAPESGFPMRAEALDVAPLLDRSVAKFRASHPKRDLRVKLEGELPKVQADAVLLRRVFDNLLDNAHKYTDDPRAPVALEAHVEDEGRAVVVEVQDRGVGIAKEDLERLFEPFFRADRSRTRATGGLGLGLTLARRVVEAHQGTITFASELGKGTVARVVLPAAAT